MFVWRRREKCILRRGKEPTGAVSHSAKRARDCRCLFALVSHWLALAISVTIIPDRKEPIGLCARREAVTVHSKTGKA